MLRPNFWDALAALRRHGILSPAIHNELRDAYDFLRTVEDRLRLIHNRGVSELPENPADLERLARRLRDEKGAADQAAQAFLADAAGVMGRTRVLFEQILVAPETALCDHRRMRPMWDPTRMDANRRRSVVLVNVSREWRVSFRLAGDRTVQLRSSDGASRSWRRHRQLWKEGRPLPEKPQGYLVWPADRQSERTNAAISGLNGTENSPTVQIPVY